MAAWGVAAALGLAAPVSAQAQSSDAGAGTQEADASAASSDAGADASADADAGRSEAAQPPDAGAVEAPPPSGAVDEECRRRGGKDCPRDKRGGRHDRDGRDAREDRDGHHGRDGEGEGGRDGKEGRDGKDGREDRDRRHHHRGEQGPRGAPGMAPPPCGMPGCPATGEGAPDAVLITEVLDLPQAIVIDQAFLSDAQAFTPRPDHAAMGADLTGFIPVFGGNAFVKPGFSATVSGMVTSKRIGAPTWFVTSGIPVEGGDHRATNAQFAMTANTSLVSLDIRARTPIAPLRLAFNTSFAQVGPGFGFHPNFAYAQLGGLTFGFSNSAFMDVDATPFTLDFEGPNALVYEKHAVLSYAFGLVHRPEARLYLTISIEQPVEGVRATGGYENRFYAPDGVLALRFEGGFGHVQLAGLARGLGLQTSRGRDNLYAFGFGGSLTTAIRLWRGANLVGGVTAGRGISAYLNDLGGLNDDAVIDADGELTPIAGLGAYGGLTVGWTDFLSSTLSYGYLVLDDAGEVAALGGAGFRYTNYAALNLVCRPSKHLTFGIEGLFGTRKVIDGSDGLAFRGQATFQASY